MARKAGRIYRALQPALTDLLSNHRYLFSQEEIPFHSGSRLSTGRNASMRSLRSQVLILLTPPYCDSGQGSGSANNSHFTMSTTVSCAPVSVLNLPPDTLVSILHHLDWKDLLRARATCPLFATVGSASQLWQRHTTERWSSWTSDRWRDLKEKDAWLYIYLRRAQVCLFSSAGAFACWHNRGSQQARVSRVANTLRASLCLQVSTAL